MEKFYKIKVISVQGRSGKVYGFPDVVSENDLPEGSANNLVKEGYIEEVEDPKKAVENNDATEYTEEEIQALKEEYTTLFGEAPHHNISVKKLVEKINSKKAES